MEPGPGHDQVLSDIDVVLDPISRDSAARGRSVAVLRPGGTLVSILPVPIDPAELAAIADRGIRYEDVDAAVEAAARAFVDPDWRDLTPAARGRLLWRIADLIDQHADEIARLETTDQGQPLVFTDVEDGMRIAREEIFGPVLSLPLLDPAAVHGGFGASGSGREFRPAGIEEFTETKGVWIGL